ncbi:hypothetical protein ACFQ0T_06030 [Kitasatospora gansuensis]
MSHLRDSGPPDRRLERLLKWLAGEVGGTAQLTGTPAGEADRLPPEAAEVAGGSRPGDCVRPRCRTARCTCG